MKAKFQPAFFSVLLASFLLGGLALARQGVVSGRTELPPQDPQDNAVEGSPVVRGQTDLPPRDTQDNAVEGSPIEIESWSPPEPGWLYVLEVGPKPKVPDDHILLFNPETSQQMGSIRTGQGADFALSPDGRQLYVASSLGGDDSELAVIATTIGAVLETATIQDRAVPEATAGIPPFSEMAVSGDGLILRILVETPGSGDAESFLLAAFDPRAYAFLPGSVKVGNCGPGRFISYPTANQFDFFCPRTNKVKLISVDDESRTLQSQDIELPWERRVGVAEALESPDRGSMALVRGDGTIVGMDVATRGFPKTVPSGIPNRVPPAAWSISPDGTRAYVGYKTDYVRTEDNRFYLDYGRPPNVRPESAMVRRFEIFDTHTWRSAGTIKTSAPFWSATISGDGKLLYAMAPSQQSILVIDTLQAKQVGTIHVSGMPALAAVAP